MVPLILLSLFACAAATTCDSVALCEACLAQQGKGWCSSSRTCVDAVPPECTSWQWTNCGPCSPALLRAPTPFSRHFFLVDGDLADTAAHAHGVGNVTFVGGLQGLAALGAWAAPIDAWPAALPRVTFGAWMRLAPASASSAIAVGDGTAMERGIYLDRSGAVSAGVGFAHNSSLPAVADAHWHCVAVSYDNPLRRATLFVDGRTQVVTATSLSDTGSLRQMVVTGASLTVDALFVYDRVLSTAELVDLCVANAQRQQPDGCVASTGWAQHAYIKASNADPNDRLGTSLALSSDGNLLAVGSVGEASNATSIAGNDNSKPGAGAVYIFERSAGNASWTQRAFIKPSNSDSQDGFGNAVALSGDGRTLLVVASREDSAVGNPLDNSVANSGAAYVFERSLDGSWLQTAVLKASNAGAGDEFGTSACISRDGTTIAVGARFEDSNAVGLNGNGADDSRNNSGAVYVFVRSGATWVQQAYVKASNTGATDEFGTTLALSADGNTLAAGAPGGETLTVSLHFFSFSSPPSTEMSRAVGINGTQLDNSVLRAGAVYVFIRSGATWTQQAYIKASRVGAREKFSVALALSGPGDTLAVGSLAPYPNVSGTTTEAGAVELFVRNGATWTQQASFLGTPVFEGHFGSALALSFEGDVLVVGAEGESSEARGVNDFANSKDTLRPSSGAIYVYERKGANPWTLQVFLKSASPDISDAFGAAVAVSYDGSLLASGAPREDSAPFSDEDDNTALESGAIFIFSAKNTHLCPRAATDIGSPLNYEVTYIKADATDKDDYFGRTLAVSGDASTLVVGAPLEDSAATGVEGDMRDNSAADSGALSVFIRRNATWVRDAYIKASNTDADDAFTEAVALSADGTTIAVGSWREASIDGNQADNSAPLAGAVYVFVRSINNSWVQQAYLKSDFKERIARFAFSVALSSDGNTLAVGASQERPLVDRYGCVYIFVRQDGGANWTRQARLTAANANANDLFGASVALSGDGRSLVVGAPQESSHSQSTPSDNTATYAGAAYLFVTTGDGAWSQVAYLKASNADPSDEFGSAVAMSADGSTVAVGAPLESSPAIGVNAGSAAELSNSMEASGAVYVFIRGGNSSVWQQEAYVKAHASSAFAHFGGSVALSATGNTLLVGARGDRQGVVGIDGALQKSNKIDSGAAHMYSRVNGVWSHVHFVKAPNCGTDDEFATAVALSSEGDTLVVGAPIEASKYTGVDAGQWDNSLRAAGAAYAFRLIRQAKNQSSLLPIDAPSRRSENRATNATAQSSTVTGGVVAGIVIVVLAPVVVVAIVIAHVAIVRRQALLAAAGKVDSYQRHQKPQATGPTHRLTILWVVIVSVALAGAALSGYALYSFISFSGSLSNPSTVFAEAAARLGNVSAWAGADCFISNVNDVAALGNAGCECYVDTSTKLWRCFTRVSLGSAQDCAIDESPWCTCSQVIVPGPGVVWTCAVDDISSYITPAARSNDLGLRFLPPGMANELASLPFFGNVPVAVGANDTFALIFAEPIPDLSPILSALLASLCLDLIGLVILMASVSIDALKRRHIVSSSFDEVTCRGRQVSIVFVVELVVLLGAVAAFGVTLVVAFSNPIVNKPEVKVMRVEAKGAPTRLGQSLYVSQEELPPRSAVVKSYCKCPLPFERRQCRANRGTIELFGGALVEFNESGVVFACPVVVLGDCVVLQPMTVAGDLRVMGSLRVDRELLVDGSVHVENGNVTGDAWGLPNAVIVTGDVIVHQGWLLLSPGATDVRFDSILGRVVLENGSIECRDATRIVLSVADLFASLSRVHVSGALNLPPGLELVVVGPKYPLVAWQSSLSVDLISSSQNVSAPITTAVQWPFMSNMVVQGVCQPVQASTSIVGTTRIRTTLSATCLGAPPSFPVVSYVSAASQVSLPPASLGYPIVTADGSLVLRFSFNRTNCATTLVAFRRELDWLTTLEQAGFGSTVFSICPRASMVVDEQALCIHYTCNGDFALPDRFSVAQQTSITQNVLQGVAFDAVATALDLLGVVLEYVVLVFVAGTALLVATATRPNPHHQSPESGDDIYLDPYTPKEQ